MTTTISLTAADGHQLAAAQATPKTNPKGTVIVLQEIFGVNSYIRSVCERLAKAGYLATAPALFDRLERDYESGYSPDEVTQSRSFLPRFDFSKAMLDVQAALSVQPSGLPISVIGFCLGGSLAFRASQTLPQIDSVVGYYGGRIPEWADSPPQCRALLHFGEADTSIPLDQVKPLQDRWPHVPVFYYPAGHGFDCDQRGSYHAPSAQLAWQRTLDFLAGS
jgi:carboxymethylenebutenolidase